MNDGLMKAWRDFATNAQVRPLMRGWVHFASLLAATTGRALGYHEKLPERAVLFVQCTMLTYLLSVCLHMVPWKTSLGYDVALSLDFIGDIVGVHLAQRLVDGRRAHV